MPLYFLPPRERAAVTASGAKVTIEAVGVISPVLDDVRRADITQRSGLRP